MADNGSEIKETTEKMGVFKQIIEDTQTEVVKLIPTLNTFFAIFKGAQIASAARQMADFYQGFKNLSFQMGKANAKSMDFLKGIYKVQKATGDTAENLNEITTILVKSRVLGEKSLPYLTKQTSFFSEITGASSSTTAQLVGNLSRMGRIGPQSINSILVSIVKVQRAFGMTSEEVENLSEHIQETTAFLNNMGKSAAFIERFEKGTVKLAAAFASVGLEVYKATSLVDRLLDPSNIEENALLYAKLGISIQDAVMGEIDPSVLEGKLRELSKTVAGMSRPVGAAFAKQLGINYGELLKYQNMDSSKAPGEEKTDSLETMAKEQRTLWTKIERFFSSGLGAAASLFLQHPLVFGGLVVSAFLTFGARLMLRARKRFNAMAEETGQKLGEAAGAAVDQKLSKSEVIKELKKNQGLQPGDKQKVGFNALRYMDASREKVKSFYGNEGYVRYEKALNKQAVLNTEFNTKSKEIETKYNTYAARLSFLEKANIRENEQAWLKRQMSNLEGMKEYTNNAYTANIKKADLNAEKALKKLSVEERTAKVMELDQVRKTAEDQAARLQPDVDKLQDMLKSTNDAIEKARQGIDGYTIKDLSALRQQSKELEAEFNASNEKLKGFNQTAEDAQKTLSKVAASGDWGGIRGGSDADYNPEGAYQQHSFWYERLWVSIKRIGSDIWTHATSPFRAIATRFSALRQKVADIAFYAKSNPVGFAFKGIGVVFKGLFKGLMKLFAPMGLAMLGLTIISKIMQRFQPLFEMMSPMLEGVFDLLATIIAPFMKILTKVGITIIGGIYNAILGIYNWIRRKLHLEEVPNKLGNISEMLKKVDEWEVGKNMEEGVKTKPAEKENGIVMNNGKNGFQVADLDTAGKYFTNYGLGNDMKDLLKAVRELNGTCDVMLDNVNGIKNTKKDEAKEKELWEHMSWAEKAAAAKRQYNSVVNGIWNEELGAWV